MLTPGESHAIAALAALIVLGCVVETLIYEIRRARRRARRGR